VVSQAASDCVPSFWGRSMETETQASMQNLRAHVEQLAGEIGERNVHHSRGLQAAAAYIERQWEQQGYVVERLAYEVSGVRCLNLEITRSGGARQPEILLMGAHYDTVMGSPGVESMQGCGEYVNFRGLRSPLWERRAYAKAGLAGEACRGLWGRSGGNRGRGGPDRKRRVHCPGNAWSVAWRRETSYRCYSNGNGPRAGDDDGRALPVLCTLRIDLVEQRVQIGHLSIPLRRRAASSSSVHELPMLPRSRG
jgi:hypothetical protein